MSDCVIINYGMGNLFSVKTAIENLGKNVKISHDSKEIVKGNIIVLPGVGSFKVAINRIKKLGLDDAIKECIINKNKKILGICLGMQLLAKVGTEDGINEGLNVFDVEVIKFQNSYNQNFKIPHVGFNQVNNEKNSILFKGISNNSDFYFNHSYYIPLKTYKFSNFSTTNYINNFISSIEYDNVFATQFHPEKSQSNGQILLENFMES